MAMLNNQRVYDVDWYDGYDMDQPTGHNSVIPHKQVLQVGLPSGKHVKHLHFAIENGHRK